MCNAPDCQTPPTRAWQRHATAAELETYKASGDLGEHETDALITLVGCTLHRVNDDLAAGTHQSTCTAPPATDGVCNCEPEYATPTPIPPPA